MKHLLILILLIPHVIHASDITTEIEKKAATLSTCSADKPCMVSVRETEDGHGAKVTKSVHITEYGVLKFLPGSVTNYIFDKNGQLLRTHRTP